MIVIDHDINIFLIHFFKRLILRRENNTLTHMHELQEAQVQILLRSIYVLLKIFFMI